MGTWLPMEAPGPLHPGKLPRQGWASHSSRDSGRVALKAGLPRAQADNAPQSPMSMPPPPPTPTFPLAPASPCREASGQSTLRRSGLCPPKPGLLLVVHGKVPGLWTPERSRASPSTAWLYVGPSGQAEKTLRGYPVGMAEAVQILGTSQGEVCSKLGRLASVPTPSDGTGPQHRGLDALKTCGVRRVPYPQGLAYFLSILSLL